MPAAPFPKTGHLILPLQIVTEHCPPGTATTLGWQQRRWALPLAWLAAEKCVLPRQGRAGTSLRVCVTVGGDQATSLPLPGQGTVLCTHQQRYHSRARHHQLPGSFPRSPGLCAQLGGTRDPKPWRCPRLCLHTEVGRGFGHSKLWTWLLPSPTAAGLGTPSTASTPHSGSGCQPGPRTQAARGSPTKDNLGP